MAKGEHPVPLNRGILVAKGRKTLTDKPWPSRLKLSNRLIPYSGKTLMVTENVYRNLYYSTSLKWDCNDSLQQTHNVSTEGPNGLLTPRTTTKLGT